MKEFSDKTMLFVFFISASALLTYFILRVVYVILRTIRREKLEEDLKNDPLTDSTKDPKPPTDK